MYCIVNTKFLRVIPPSLLWQGNGRAGIISLLFIDMIPVLFCSV